MMGSHNVTGKYMLCSYTCIMDPLVLEMAQKVVKSVKISLQGHVEPYILVVIIISPQRRLNTNRGYSWTSDMSQRAASGKADQ